MRWLRLCDGGVITVRSVLMVLHGTFFLRWVLEDRKKQPSVSRICQDVFYWESAMIVNYWSRAGKSKGNEYGRYFILCQRFFSTYEALEKSIYYNGY
ncbi:predicted protein [Enterococcus faecalis HIP11704]|nr:predicted protein [Enterococcus faecalis HIP11704]